MTKQLRDVIRLKNGKVLKITAIDACKLLIDASSVAYVNINRNKDQDVVSIDFEGEQSVSVGDEINIRVGLVHTVYKIKTIIVSKGQTSVILFSSLPTKTNTFLLPLLNKTKFQLKYDSYFVNSYLSDDHEYLCLMYRYTGTPLYKTFEQSILSDKLCVKHLDHDNYHVIYLFKIPNEFKDDIDYFIKGKYSKFSKELKRRIMKFYGVNMDSTISQIIFKSPKLKQMIEKDLGVTIDNNAELASVPVLEDEIYTLN